MFRVTYLGAAIVKMLGDTIYPNVFRSQESILWSSPRILLSVAQ